VPSPTGREMSNRCRSWEGLLAPLPARQKGARVTITGAKEREEARGGGRGGGAMCGRRGHGVGEREGEGAAAQGDSVIGGRIWERE
jgi:hypothetical protein